MKISLSGSAFSLLVTISLGCTLSYCFFENGLTFLPFVSYLLKDQVESFFLFLKKSLTTLKESFSFTGNQTKEKGVGAEQVVKMKKPLNNLVRRVLEITLEINLRDNGCYQSQNRKIV